MTWPESTDGSGHKLAAFYAIPSDTPYDPDVHERLIEATLDIQAWYQCATGGLTLDLAFPEIVQVYVADENRQFYVDNGDWWNSLVPEMGSNGLPIWTSGFISAIWARGAGHWAGGAQSCGGNCGTAMLGISVFPEFNDPTWSGQACPGGQGIAAWPCTPLGAMAHEIGHALGLPHPIDDPATEEHANHSVMQTHWNYPDFAPPSETPWGFLTLERQALFANPFPQTGIDLLQLYPDCGVVNLPDTGATPVADFKIDIDDSTVTATNTSTGASLYLWTFGDDRVSNDANPVHLYTETGEYQVRMRASNSATAMMDTVTQDVVIDTISGYTVFENSFESVAIFAPGKR